MLRKPERALKREIARLAQCDADDLAAVLDELDAPHRDRVEALLQALVLPDPRASDGPFASWVNERLAGGAVMTDEARRLLARCAARIAPVQPARSPSLFERALGGGSVAR